MKTKYLECIIKIIGINAIFIILMVSLPRVLRYWNPEMGYIWHKQEHLIAMETLSAFLEDGQEWESVIEARRNWTEAMCPKFANIFTSAFKLQTFVHVPDTPLAYCRNGKAGTSTWLRILYEFSDTKYVNHTQAHLDAQRMEFIPSLNGGESEAEEIRFTAVRHPFTRLVSAYRDKVPENYRRDLMKNLIQSRKNDSDAILDLENWRSILQEIGIDVQNSPTFREFILFVLDEIETCLRLPKPALMMCGHNIDTHWKPYYIRCNPCQGNYNFISKIETIDNDIKYLGRKMFKILLREEMSRLKPSHEGLTEQSSKSLLEYLETGRTFNKTRFSRLITTFSEYKQEHSSSGPSTEVLTKKFMALLSNSERMRLEKAYGFDFILFQYDPKEFYGEYQ